MITLVTGNPGKLRELQAMAPPELELTHQGLDLEEIQSLNLHAIVEHKVRQAYQLVGGPVIVEDVAAGLTSLHGLPGPFIKFFNQELGGDSLYKLSKVKDDRVTVTCLVGYFDGERLEFGEGTITGTIVPPRGEHGFGFDVVIMPEGMDRTMAELSDDEKNAISHRGQAFRALLKTLSSNL